VIIKISKKSKRHFRIYGITLNRNQMEKQMVKLNLSSPVKANNNAAVKYNPNTGLMAGQGYTSQSGLTYWSGTREFEGLKIRENIAEGTAVNYINSVQVFDKTNNLIIDEAFPKHTYYTREIVRKRVLKSLIRLMKDAAVKENRSFNETTAASKVDDLLKTAYYQKSYNAVLEWAKQVGIEIN
jgi:hypothetical protein